MRQIVKIIGVVTLNRKGGKRVDGRMDGWDSSLSGVDGV
jgi:hypothetical protein